MYLQIGGIVLVLGACAAPERPSSRNPATGRPAGGAGSSEHGGASTSSWEAPAPAEPVLPRDAPPPLKSLRDFSREEQKRIRRVQKHVNKAAAAHGVDPYLINGIIWVESKFERRARGRRGPRGLMQIMPRTARYVARKLRRKYRPYSASFNIDAGTFYFAQMVQQFDGNTVLALVAYHRGPAEVRAWLQTDEPMPGVSLRYVQNVLSAAAAFRERDGEPEEH